jgi:tryptophan synthase alpha chain
MAGDGGLDRTLALLRALDTAEGGPPAAIELGVPFTDPIADGPLLRAAADRALAAGTTLTGVLELVWRYRAGGGKTPLYCFSYANPLIARGASEGAKRLLDSGFDGALVPDLPLEEWRPFAEAQLDLGLAPIPFCAPTTSPKRLAAALELGRGFLYAIARLGITGSSTAVSAELLARLDDLSAASPIPVGVGFGLRTRDAVAALAGHADLAIVGSALVDTIHRAALAAGPGSPTERAATAARHFLTRLQR